MGPVDGGVDSGLYYLMLYFPPAPSGLCQPAQTFYASEICHVVFSINIRVHRIAGVLGSTGGKSVTVRGRWEGGR